MHPKLFLLHLPKVYLECQPEFQLIHEFLHVLKVKHITYVPERNSGICK